MYAQALITIILLAIVLIAIYKIGIKPLLKKAGVEMDDEKEEPVLNVKTAEELEAEIADLQKAREELMLKEQSIEVLAEKKNVEKQLEKVNKAREKLKS